MTIGAGGNVTQRFMHGLETDQLLTVDDVPFGITAWALADHRGTINEYYGHDGTSYKTLMSWRFDEFGNVKPNGSNIQATPPNIAPRFAGRELDESTGLHYNRARYYSPSMARFISEDPMGFSAGDANLYRYVGNSPANNVDPFGNLFFVPFLRSACNDLVSRSLGAAAQKPFGFRAGSVEKGVTCGITPLCDGSHWQSRSSPTHESYDRTPQPSS